MAEADNLESGIRLTVLVIFNCATHKATFMSKSPTTKPQGKLKSSPDIANFGVANTFLQHPKNGKLRRMLLKAIPINVPFAALAPLLPLVAFSTAANHFNDGDLSMMDGDDWYEALLSNHIPIRSLKDAETVRKLLNEVEFLLEDTLRSWSKFNAHKANQERRKKQNKKNVEKRWAAVRERQAREARQEETANNHPDQSKTTPAREMTATQEISLIDKAIEEAHGNAAAVKALKAKRKEVLARATGQDLSKPKSSQPRGQAPQEKAMTDAELYESARYTIETLKRPDLLTPEQREAFERVENSAMANV